MNLGRFRLSIAYLMRFWPIYDNRIEATVGKYGWGLSSDCGKRFMSFDFETAAERDTIYDRLTKEFDRHIVAVEKQEINEYFRLAS